MKTRYYNCQFNFLNVCLTTRSVKLTNTAAENPKLSHMSSYFVAFLKKKIFATKTKGTVVYARTA